MCSPSLSYWQQVLVTRLQDSLGRPLVDADMVCIAWNAATQTLTVEAPPLLGELRSRNLISNIFRSRKLAH
jgi:hypothetical protein